MHLSGFNQMVFCWMIGGNLLTHFSPKVLEGCQQQNKKLVCLPLKCPYLMQPLDVAFSRPSKQAWRNILLSWGSSAGRRLLTLPKYQFPTLLTILSEAIKPNCVKNLESGFRTCGIYPLNPQPSLLKLPTKEIIPEKQLWQ